MKKTDAKPKPSTKATTQKKDAKIAEKTAPKPFSKFQKNKPRNENNSNVGPSWGGRKGN
jgi:hypothetical protein